MRQRRNFGALHQTRQQIDEQQHAPAAPGPSPEERAQTPRTWTRYGGMVPQQDSARKWIRQNAAIRAAANQKGTAGLQAEETKSSATDRAQGQMSQPVPPQRLAPPPPQGYAELKGEAQRDGPLNEYPRQSRTEMNVSDAQITEATAEQKQAELNEARKEAQAVREREAAERQQEQTQERDRDGPER